MSDRMRNYLGGVAALISMALTLQVGTAMVLPDGAEHPKFSGPFNTIAQTSKLLADSYKAGNHAALLVGLVTLAAPVLVYWLIAGRSKTRVN